MELKSSTISETWKLCTVGGFLGFLVLALFLTSNTTGRGGPTTTGNVDLSSSSRTFITFFSATSSSSSPPSADDDRVSPVADDLPSTPAATTTSTTATTAAAKVEQVDNTAAADNATVTAAANSTTTTPLFVEDDEVDPAPDNPTADVTDDVDHPASTNSTADDVNHPAPNNSTADVTSDAAGEVDNPPHDNNSNTTTTDEPTSSNTTAATNTSTAAATASNATEFDLDDGTAAVVAEELAEVEKEKQGSCNMFEGRWVYRPEVSPMYSVYQCPFLEDKMSCRRNGRPDVEYEGYVWEPTGCDIPLFNGKDMLERLKGKRVIVAGDSLNRNMWESLACLIYTSISPSRAFVDAQGSSYKVLKAMDYDFTLEFYWCPFLVYLEERHNKRGRTKRVLHLDRMVPSSEQWRGADVMVFDSGHWWTHGVGNYKKWDVYERAGKQHAVESIPVETAYETGLTTWSNWISANVDRNKTAVFFRSISPEHKGKQWCFNATRPIPDDSYVNIFPKRLMEVAERVVGANEGIRYLNITWMSGYRRDAHPAMYRYEEWKWKVLTAKYMRTVPQQADCSHWCLPGLPDTWNRLLYASLFYSEGTVNSGGGKGRNEDSSRIEEERKTGSVMD